MKKIIFIKIFLLFFFGNIFSQVPLNYSDSFLDSLIDLNSISIRKVKSIKEIAEKLNISDTNKILQYSILAKWVVNTLNYNYSAKSSESAIWAVKNKKGVCFHYAKIFDSLCKYLNFESNYIDGYVKEYDSEYKMNLVYHAWTSVKINNQVFLTDLTWCDGDNDKKSKNANLLKNYFLISPDKFIMSHYPRKKRFKFTHYSKKSFKKSFIYERGYFLIDENYNHNLNQFLIDKSNELVINLKQKVNESDFILKSFELLPCADCYNFTEVIEFEKINDFSFSIKNKESLKIENNSPVLLLLVYYDIKNEKEYVVPVIEFLWNFGNN